MPGGLQFVAGYEIETLAVVRIEFHDLGDRTRVALTDGPFPPSGTEHAAAGYAAAFDKLATCLAR